MVVAVWDDELCMAQVKTAKGKLQETQGIRLEAGGEMYFFLEEAM